VTGEFPRESQNALAPDDREATRVALHDHAASSARRREDVEWAVADWVQWYNTKRLLGPIGYIPPAEVEAAFHAETGGYAKAA